MEFGFTRKKKRNFMLPIYAVFLVAALCSMVAALSLSSEYEKQEIANLLMHTFGCFFATGFYYLGLEYYRDSDSKKVLFTVIGVVLSLFFGFFAGGSSYNILRGTEMTAAGAFRNAFLPFSVIFNIFSFILYFNLNEPFASFIAQGIALIASYLLQVLILLFPVWILSIIGAVLALLIIAGIISKVNDFGWFDFFPLSWFPHISCSVSLCSFPEERNDRIIINGSYWQEHCDDEDIKRFIEAIPLVLYPDSRIPFDAPREGSKRSLKACHVEIKPSERNLKGGHFVSEFPIGDLENDAYLMEFNQEVMRLMEYNESYVSHGKKFRLKSYDLSELDEVDQEQCLLVTNA